MTRKLKRLIVKDLVHSVAIGIQLGGDYEDGQKWFTKRWDSDWDIETGIASNIMARTLSKGRELFIWFRDRRPGCGIVAHECFHAAYHVLSRELQVRVDDNNEEIFAYYLDWLVREIGKGVWGK